MIVGACKIDLYERSVYAIIVKTKFGFEEEFPSAEQVTKAGKIVFSDTLKRCDGNQPSHGCHYKRAH